MALDSQNGRTVLGKILAQTKGLNEMQVEQCDPFSCHNKWCLYGMLSDH